jgi:transketolase
MAHAENTTKGAYVLIEAAGGQPDVILIATGSEVQLAVAAREQLATEGIHARVVSAPCMEWFFEQPQSYQDAVLPPQVTARVSVEAGISMSWDKIVGSRGRSVSIEHFGASADYKTLFREFGMTSDAVVAAAHDSLNSL